MIDSINRDTIYRQDAIDALDCINGVEEVLRSLPSAQTEERALHESCTDCPLYDHGRHSCPRFNKVIPETLREAQQEQRWIPVSERLPKKHGESYLVTISDGAVYTAELQWDANGKRWYLSFLNDGNILVDFIDDVIAWMPLPTPWEGGQDGQTN